MSSNNIEQSDISIHHLYDETEDSSTSMVCKKDIYYVYKINDTFKLKLGNSLTINFNIDAHNIILNFFIFT